MDGGEPFDSLLNCTLACVGRNTKCDSSSAVHNPLSVLHKCREFACSCFWHSDPKTTRTAPFFWTTNEDTPAFKASCANRNISRPWKRGLLNLGGHLPIAPFSGLGLLIEVRMLA